MEKETLYRQLVQRRKECARCVLHLDNASTIADGTLDCDEIGAYSRWQGNLNAELMVVAQDFANVDGFCKYKGWPGETVQTNLALVELIAEAGITIEPPRAGVSDDRLFFTNAVLCMKRAGGMQGRVPKSCVRECGRQFLRPMIQLVAPRIVVTLGSKAMAATCAAFGRESPGRLACVVAQPIRLNERTELVPLYHPSPTVLNTIRSLDAQRADWRKLAGMLCCAETKQF
jgi:DNA polymerase